MYCRYPVTDTPTHQLKSKQARYCGQTNRDQILLSKKAYMNFVPPLFSPSHFPLPALPPPAHFGRKYPQGNGVQLHSDSPACQSQGLPERQASPTILGPSNPLELAPWHDRSPASHFHRHWGTAWSSLNDWTPPPGSEYTVRSSSFAPGCRNSLDGLPRWHSMSRRERNVSSKHQNKKQNNNKKTTTQNSTIILCSTQWTTHLDHKKCKGY